MKGGSWLKIANDRNEIVIVFLKLGECVRLELS